MPNITSLEEPDAATIKSFLAAIEAFRAIRHTMPLQYVVAFLLVATEQGLSVSEYANRAGISMSVMSRHLLDIGERNRHMEAGFGLVYAKPDPMDLRTTQMFLSPKGLALLHQILRRLKH